MLGVADIFGVDFYYGLELLEKVFEDCVACVAKPGSHVDAVFLLQLEIFL